MNHYSTDPDYLEAYLVALSCHLSPEGLGIAYTLKGKAMRLHAGPKEASKLLCDLEILHTREVAGGDVWVQANAPDEWGVYSPTWMHWDQYAADEDLGLLWAKQIAIRYLQDQELKHALWLYHCQDQLYPELN
jgi:hypothetical protein